MLINLKREVKSEDISMYLVPIKQTDLSNFLQLEPRFIPGNILMHHTHAHTFLFKSSHNKVTYKQYQYLEAN